MIPANLCRVNNRAADFVRNLVANVVSRRIVIVDFASVKSSLSVETPTRCLKHEIYVRRGDNFDKHTLTALGVDLCDLVFVSGLSLLHYALPKIGNAKHKITLQSALRIFFVIITASGDRNSEAGGSDLAERPDWFADLVVKTLHHTQNNAKQNKKNPR